MNIKSIDRLTELMDDWKYFFETNSWDHAFWVVITEIVRLPFRYIKYLVFARSIMENFPEHSSQSSFVFRNFDASDLPGVAKINRPSEARLCARRLAKGHVGVSALYQERLVGYAWACPEIDLNIERININLEPFDFLCTDAFTSPDFRGKGIQTLLTVERFRKLHELGYKRAVCYIEKGNLPSISTWKKLGSQRVGNIDFIRIGSWRYSRYRNYCTLDQK